MLQAFHLERLQPGKIEDAFEHLVQPVRFLQDHIEILDLAVAAPRFFAGPSRRPELGLS